MNTVLKMRRALFKNSGIALFGLNLLLVAILIFLYDPFGIVSSGYEGAALLVPVSADDLDRIEAISPTGTFLLTKGEAIPKSARTENGTTGGSSKYRLMDPFDRQSYEWLLSFEVSGSAKRYPADRKRMTELFNALNATRRYYSLPLTKEKMESVGLGELKNGGCECLELRFHLKNGTTERLSVGRSGGSGESYVRLNDEEELYLVETDLRKETGYGKLDYFRNRKLLDGSITRDSITGIRAGFADRRRDVMLDRIGGVWQMMKPVAGKADADFLAGELVELDVETFPETLPSDLDRSLPFRLEVIYKKNLTDVASVAFEILGRKGENTFYLRNAEGELMEVFSTYLGDLYDPEGRFLKKESLLEGKIGHEPQ